ncbi:MAG: oligosaccharide flippase family protein [Actinobacteria bacterium]|nr:oligosaccharide flippase family protein [Actinomycetota bacterium]
MTEVRAGDVAREGEEPQAGPGGGLGIGALAQDAAIYGGARVLLKSLAFLLVPLYAHFLAPAQFGVLELVLATIAFVDVLIAANMDGVFARFYFDRPDEGWRRQIISLYLAIAAFYPTVVIGGLIALSGPLSGRIFGTTEYTLFLVIALCDLYLTNIVDLPMLLCRVRRKPVTFAVYSLSRGLVQVVFAVLFVAVFHLGVKGILLSSLIAVGFALLVTAREYLGDLTRKVDWGVGREMVEFAWPGILGGMAFYGLNLIDRFFVKHYHGLADAGLYGTAFRYSQVVLVAVFAFRLGWTSWHYSWLHSGRHTQMVARGANYYFVATGFLAVVVSAWILPVFHVLMPESYREATTAVAPLALAAVALGAYNIFVVGLNVTKRMRIAPVLSLSAAALAIGLYFLLIPRFSFQGAAWATASSFAALALLTAFVTQRIYPVPWDVRRILLAVGLAAALCLAALWLDRNVDLDASLPLRAVLTLAFPGALLALGFFRGSELGRARALLRRGRSS